MVTRMGLGSLGGVWVLGVVGAVASACGGSDDGGGDAGAGGLAAGGGGSGGGTPGPAVCTPPEGATVVLDWRVRDRDPESGSPVYHLAVDGGHLYVQMLDHVERVPVGGGAAEIVFANRAEIPVFTNAWARSDDRMLVIDGEGAVLVPKAGGAATELELPDEPWLAGVSALGNPYDQATNELYASKFESVDGVTKTTFFKVAVVTATQTVLAPDVETENIYAFDASEGGFYYQPTAGEAVLQATRDAGATWEAVTFTAAGGTDARFAGVHGGQAYFVVTNFEAGFNGLARGPVTGGPLMLVADNYILSTQLEKSEGYVALNDAEELIVLRIDGGARVIPLAIGPDCTSHAVAVGAGHVFSSFFHASTGESLVFALPL